MAKCSRPLPSRKPPLFQFVTLVLSALVASVFASVALAGPQVDVIVGPQAPTLERFAAQELAGQFKKLFNAEIRLGENLPERWQNLIVLGSPATNPAVKQIAGPQWPRLTDQGHLVRSVPCQGRKALLVGGGSPVATLWAVYELGYRLGIRYFLSGDLFPPGEVAFKLDSFDILLEPNLRLRTWRTINDFPIGPESWGLAEQRLVLGQLAKQKFNRVMLAVYPWQPFVHYEFKGVKKQTATLWYGYHYPVDGDTAGRAAFHGAREFTNPDFAGKNTYEQRTSAGIALARGIIDSAHGLGMTAAIAISPLEFPREFAPALPGAKTLKGLEDMTIGPGRQQSLDDPVLKALVATKIRAYLSTYPQLDALYLTMPEFPDWSEHYEEAWKQLDTLTGLGKTTALSDLMKSAQDRHLIASGQRGVQALRGNIMALAFLHSLLGDRSIIRRPDGKEVKLVIVDLDPALFSVADKVLPGGAGLLSIVDYTARRVDANKEFLKTMPSKHVKSSLILTLADDNIGMLPQASFKSLQSLVKQIQTLGWEGFSSRYWIVGDLDPAVHYLARASFDDRVTPRTAWDDLTATPVFGDGVAERLAKAFDMIEEATTLIDANDLGFAFPVPGVVMKHYSGQGPPPAWWKQVTTQYGTAMDEMYRALTRSHPVGRPFILRLAKRLEFAVEYLSCIDALRLAGLAKSKRDPEKQVENLEKAVEAMYNALSALGEVAGDNSDRGVIAVLNEYGYRPLKKELEAVEKAGAGKRGP